MRLDEFAMFQWGNIGYIKGLFAHVTVSSKNYEAFETLMSTVNHVTVNHCQLYGSGGVYIFDRWHNLKCENSTVKNL